jgi:hypothetical protein
MERSKIVAILTGAIAIILSLAYLLLVQFLDFRGEMLPAPTDLSALPALSPSALSARPIPLNDSATFYLAALD